MDHRTTDVASAPSGQDAAEGFSPFDPGEPFDAMADMFRRQITQFLIDAEKITIYRELDPQSKLECFVGGILTGLVGCCFAHVRPEGYDAIMDYIAECLPFARQQSEGVRLPDGTMALADEALSKD
jgi:hypothetical protein